MFGRTTGAHPANLRIFHIRVYRFANKFYFCIREAIKATHAEPIVKRQAEAGQDAVRILS